MTESPAKRDIVQRLNQASTLAGVSSVAFLAVLFTDLGVWIAGLLFLLGVASAFGAGGFIVGHWRVGVLFGLFIGAAYLATVFYVAGPSGGHSPGAGWPIMIIKGD